jgi:general secretion pathway protein J
VSRGEVRPNGFTLLEILVALVVFGLVLAGLTQGIRYGMQAWQSQVRIASRSGDLDAVDRALRRMIEVMDPGDSQDDVMPVAATRNRLEFNTVLPDSTGTRGVQRVAAALLVDPSHRLVLRWRPLLHAQRLRPPPPTVTELLSDVAGLELSFWQPTGGWVDGWRSQVLPALVRIRIVFRAGDPRHWPDLVVAPLLDRP